MLEQQTLSNRNFKKLSHILKHVEFLLKFDTSLISFNNTMADIQKGNPDKQ